ncbi:MAG: hypothetical protein GDA36_07155 [Rhodobacteraceae bacterium]|nr:hypothetical protein [Paracoccaceae bacterium]
MRLVEDASLAAVTLRHRARPRVTYRITKPTAVAVFNRVYFTRDWCLDDYAPAILIVLYMVEAMLLAHEMTHIWQWESRDAISDHPLLAAAGHGMSDDTYLFELNGVPNFLSYDYKQHAAIVEGYVCYRALVPDTARTKQLCRMFT